MKATDLLKQQHREVEELFERIENAEAREKKALFEELATNLVAHDAIEREIFYPACERQMGDEEILREALVEHGLVEFTLFQADRETRDEDALDARIKVLKDIVEHHVEEEEKELFPKVEKALSGQLEQLGAAMEARFEEAKEEDFRTPLQKNVRQVIGGAVKTTPARGASARRTTRAATGTRAKTARGGSASRGSSRTKSTAKRGGAAKKTAARKGGRSRASR
jgi:hemerythrin superfamily protein